MYLVDSEATYGFENENEECTYLLENVVRYEFATGIKSRAGHAQLFFESAIAIPQLEGSTSAIAIPQLFRAMLIRNRNSAIVNFSEVRNFKSAT